MNFLETCLVLSGIFYAVLCVFSIVTGIIYMIGKRELNPLELSDKFMQKLDTKEKRQQFAKKMGFVTFVVGCVQGLTSYAILGTTSRAFLIFAIAFTIFSIASVLVKLKGKISAFPLIKLVFYVSIMVVLILH